jgi:hypothetical protein
LLSKKREGFPAIPSGADIYTKEYIATNFEIKQKVTTYAMTTFELMVDQPYHIIGFEAVETPQTRQFVHVSYSSLIPRNFNFIPAFCC